MEEKHDKTFFRELAFTAGPSDDGLRLDVFLSAALEGELSREKIKQAVLRGQVSFNGRPCLAPKRRLAAGDKVLARLESAPPELQPEDGELRFIYRDPFLAALDKPAGLTVHPCPSCPTGTLAQRLIRHCPELAATPAGEGLRPGIVHRLDKDSSGLLLVALEEPVRLKLSSMFSRREIYKEYLALVRGTPQPAAGMIAEPIGRHPSVKTKMAVLKSGRPAQSDYRTLYADPLGRFALLAVRIHTGRTHQIRVHLTHLGHPILGDSVYGPKNQASDGHPAKVPHCAASDNVYPSSPSSIWPGPGTATLAAPPARQMLHAWKLKLKHPASGVPLDFCLSPPEDFAASALFYTRNPRRVVITGVPGCGKSAVLKALDSLGLPTWSADAAVARLYQPGADGCVLLRGRFGERFVPDRSGPVDKAALFKAMCTEPALRKELEALIHPLVFHDMQSFWQAHTDPDQPLFAEVPLYLEGGRDKKQPGPGSEAPLLVGVFCPERTRLERLTKLRGWPESTVALMDSWQWSQKEKMRACHLVLDNSGDLAALQALVSGLPALLADLRLAGQRHFLAELNKLWGC